LWGGPPRLTNRPSRREAPPRPAPTPPTAAAGPWRRADRGQALLAETGTTLDRQSPSFASSRRRSPPPVRRVIAPWACDAGSRVVHDTKLVQGTPEWPPPAQYRNASETRRGRHFAVADGLRAVAGRTGRAVAPGDAGDAPWARARAATRAAYESLTGLVMEPLVLVGGVRPRSTASRSRATSSSRSRRDARPRPGALAGSGEKQLPEFVFYQVQRS
jgi:hypothetical protein